MVQRRNLIGGERYTKLQPQGLLRVGGVIHQVSHLLQIGADTVQVAVTGLVQHGIADITGIKCGITEETVVVIRFQVDAIQHVG